MWAIIIFSTLWSLGRSWDPKSFFDQSDWSSPNYASYNVFSANKIFFRISYAMFLALTLVYRIGRIKYLLLTSCVITLCRYIYWYLYFNFFCWVYKSSRIWANFRRTWNLILNFFSLLILVVHTLSLKNPSDATLASLSISIYPRWRLRRRPILSEKIVWYGKKCLKPIFPLNC